MDDRASIDGATKKTAQPRVITLVVFGRPQTAGSKRAFPFKRRNGKLGVAVSDDNPNSRDWKNAVASAAREVFHGDLLDCALSVSLVFYLPRPKGHFGKRGLRPAAPQYPTTKPDVLKLTRAAEDALASVVYRDDSQIVHEVLEKRYGEPARVEITIREKQPRTRDCPADCQGCEKCIRVAQLVAATRAGNMAAARELADRVERLMGEREDCKPGTAADWVRKSMEPVPAVVLAALDAACAAKRGV